MTDHQAKQLWLNERYYVPLDSVTWNETAYVRIVGGKAMAAARISGMEFDVTGIWNGMLVDTGKAKQVSREEAFKTSI